MNERRIWIIAGIVAIAHFSGIAWLEWRATPERYTPPKDRLVVKTVQLSPEKKEKKIAASTPPPVKKSAPPKKSKPPVKKAEAKAKPQKKVSQHEERKGDLIAQARERLSQVGKTSKKIDQAKGVESLKIDSLESGVEDHGYYTLLAGALRQNLRLPEFGEVKIHLTLDCQGKVIHVKIVNAQNENNQRYVEKVLPKVVFPPFEKAFKNEKEHTFTITLANDL